MTKLLLDAHLGPRTAAFLAQRFALDASSIISRGLDHLDDVVLERSLVVIDDWRVRVETAD